MNIREKLSLHTDLISEQIHTLEKLFEHMVFLKVFYDDFKFIIPGKKQSQAIVVFTDSQLTLVPTEEPEFVALLNEENPCDPGCSTPKGWKATPIFFGANKFIAVVLYKEKRGFPLPTLEHLMECCRKDLPSGYPANYLVPDGLMVFDADGRVQFSNYVGQIICQRLSISGEIDVFGIMGSELSQFLNKPTFMSNYVQVKNFDVSIIAIPLFNNGQFFGAFTILSDLTLVKKKEKELIKKSTVIKEIHHRVKNNLQTIMSLLRLQMRRTNSKQVEKAFNESINRILSIAIIHEALAHQELEYINIKQTVYKILETILVNMVDPNKSITGEIYGDDVFLTAFQASNLSLCVTELIQNAVEHAFVNQTQGVIRVMIKQSGNEVNVSVQDNGIGISAEQTENIQSLGMQIVKTITQNNLNGNFLVNGSRKGTTARILFSNEKGGDSN